MKRWQDRNLDEGTTERDAPAQGPLSIEPLAPRGRRLRLALPAAVGAIVLITMLAFAGKYVSTLNSLNATPVASPTPISWIDATAEPTPSSAPTVAASSSPALVVSIHAEGTVVSWLWYRGQANHFTIDLLNDSGKPIPLDPCPTYRMYILGPGADQGPDRLLNCAAIGPELAAGQAVSLDMAFTIPHGEPSGIQEIEWTLVSPPGYQAVVLLTGIYIEN
jgi:hypothetical protein